VDFIGARMMEMVVTTGAIRREKLHVNHYHNKPKTTFLWAGYPSCCPFNGVRELKGCTSILHTSKILHQCSPIEMCVIEKYSKWKIIEK